jgi:hypothetical protein
MALKSIFFFLSDLLDEKKKMEIQGLSICLTSLAAALLLQAPHRLEQE